MYLKFVGLFFGVANILVLNLLVPWKQLCSNKESGGLGFRDVKLWNIACLGVYVWEISSKQDNVWIKWINSVYLRVEDW